jgi:hypothetical protein
VKRRGIIGAWASIKSYKRKDNTIVYSIVARIKGTKLVFKIYENKITSDDLIDFMTQATKRIYPQVIAFCSTKNIIISDDVDWYTIDKVQFCLNSE